VARVVRQESCCECFAHAGLEVVFFKFICKWEEYSLHILGIIHDFAVSIEIDPFGAREMLQAMLAEDCDGQKCVLKFVRLEGG